MRARRGYSDGGRDDDSDEQGIIASALTDALGTVVERSRRDKHLVPAADDDNLVQRALRIYAVRELKAHSRTGERDGRAEVDIVGGYDPVVHLLLLLLAGELASARHLAARWSTAAGAAGSTAWTRGACELTRYYYESVGEPLVQRDYGRFFARTTTHALEREQEQRTPASDPVARDRRRRVYRRLCGVLRRAVMHSVLALISRAYATISVREVASTLAMASTHEQRRAVVRVCTAAPYRWRVHGDLFILDARTAPLGRDDDDDAEEEEEVEESGGENGDSSLWPSRWSSSMTMDATRNGEAESDAAAAAAMFDQLADAELAVDKP